MGLALLGLQLGGYWGRRGTEEVAPWRVLITGLGGAAGALLRYWLALALVPRVRPDALAAVTLTINLLGSFVLGLVLGLLFDVLPSGKGVLEDRAALALAVGLCGSLPPTRPSLRMSGSSCEAAAA